MKIKLLAFASVLLLSAQTAFASEVTGNITRIETHYNGKIHIKVNTYHGSCINNVYEIGTNENVSETARMLMLKLLKAAQLSGMPVTLDFDTGATPCIVKRVIVDREY